MSYIPCRICIPILGDTISFPEEPVVKPEANTSATISPDGELILYSRNRLLSLPPLFSAVCKRHITAVEALLYAGADVDYTDPYNGRTCLHLCLESQSSGGLTTLTCNPPHVNDRIAVVLLSYAARAFIADSNELTAHDLRLGLLEVQRQLVAECVTTLQQQRAHLPLDTEESQGYSCLDDLASNVTATKSKHHRRSHSKLLDVDKRYS